MKKKKIFFSALFQHLLPIRSPLQGRCLRLSNRLPHGPAQRISLRQRCCHLSVRMRASNGRLQSRPQTSAVDHGFYRGMWQKISGRRHEYVSLSFLRRYFHLFEKFFFSFLIIVDECFS